MLLSKVTSHAVRTAARCGRQQFGVLAPIFGSGPNQNGLDEQFSGTPALIPMEIPPPTTANATTSQGISLVSEESRSPLATVTVNIGVGSRDTTLGTAGTALLLKHLAFSTTENRSSLRICRELEDIGASVSASVGRESLTINAAVQAQSFTTLIDIIGDSVSNLAIKDYEVKDLLHFVGEDVAVNGASGAAALSDAIHASAYYDSLTLGLPLYGDISGATRDAAASLAQDAFVGSNITVVGTGVDHDQFSQGVGDKFAGVASGSFGRQASEYVGGEARVSRGGSTANIAVALNTAGQSAAAVSVLATLLGSATRSRTHSIGGRTGGRATQILAAHDALGSVSGFANTYSDGGLVGLTATTNASDTEAAFAALAGALRGSVTDAEVQRAKAVLAGNAALARDSQQGRAAAFVAEATGSAPSAADIAAVTTADVTSALNAALASAPSFATVGDLNSTPRYNALSALFR